MSKKPLRGSLTFIVIILCLYSLLLRFSQSDSFFAPSWTLLRHEGQRLIVERSLGKHILASCMRVATASCISLVLALGLSALARWSRYLRHLIINPLVMITKYIPVPSLAPLALVIFGVGEESKVFLLVVGMTLPLISLLINSADRIPHEYFFIARSLKRNIRRIILMKYRAIADELYDGMRISVLICRTYIIIAELLASEYGLGYLIKESQRFANMASMYIVIIILVIIGASTDRGFQKLKPLLFPYLRDDSH